MFAPKAKGVMFNIKSGPLKFVTFPTPEPSVS